MTKLHETILSLQFNRDNALTREENEKAWNEGWGLFDTGKEDTPFEIQRVDEMEKFTGDEGAWLHVASQAMVDENSIHLKALVYIAVKSPNEFTNICQCAFQNGIK